ncbi:hypothetical protein FRB96_009551 [Tulasnella sp. 330]|nr:hypothetical protein FRB96_009551 [Tulasnella sp. 330]
MEDAVTLTVYIATVTDKTIRPLDPANTAPAARKRIEEFFERIVNYDRDASTLAAMKQKVADAITCIQLETAVATNQEIELIRQKQDAIYEDQQRIIRQQQDAEIARLIGLLGTQDSGSSKKPPCLDGTRISLLDKISRWIENRPESGPCALCLKGSAGVGKSSVGATIAGEQRAAHRLGAEFYFTADQQDRNEAVVVVLARQLASWSKGKLRFDIADAIDEDAEIMRRAPEVQFRQLIQGPLETLAADPDNTTLVVLLDGLDECNEDFACRLLTAVGEALGKLPATVRIVITSRPEPHLLDFYTSEPMKSQTDTYSLDTEEILQLKRDIWKYFKEELPKMVKKWVKDSVDWPGEERRTMLVELSQGLFIHATTVARMLADSAIRNPEKQLEAVLSSHGHANGDYGHNTHLDNVYSAVLSRACPQNSIPDLLALFRNVLGTIHVVQVPINIHTLACLLCPQESKLEDYTHDIRTTVLAYLQAVLIVPGVEEADPSRNAPPVHFIHKSFEDYLTDKSRCDPRLLLDTAHFNRNMAIRCLTFPGLKRNICDLDPSRLNSEVDAPFVSDTSVGVVVEEGDKEVDDGDEDDEHEHEKEADEGKVQEVKDRDREVSGFQRRVQDYVSAGLQYACEQWPKHVSREPPESDRVILLLEKFVRTDLLHWVEVVSLIGKMGELIGSIELVESWLKAKPPLKPLEPLTPAASSPDPPHHPLPSAVHWIEMVRNNTYRRLLAVGAFTPSHSTLLHADSRRHDMAITLESLKQSSPLKGAPVPLEASLANELHSPIMALLLLQELKFFIHEFMEPISTNSSQIHISALSFMPAQSPLFHVYSHMADGPSVHRGRLQRWSTPDDHGVRFKGDEDALHGWSTGTPIREVLINQPAGFNCVAWSPNGRMIVSGSTDHTLCRWDALTRTPIGEVLNGHADAIWDVAWSPDSKTFVSASEDHTLYLWDASTGRLVGEAFKGHAAAVYSVAWSPNGNGLKTALFDYGLCPLERVWRCRGSILEQSDVLPGHLMAVQLPRAAETVSFVYSFYLMENLSEIPTDQDGTVWQVTWSPDSKMIVTACQDATIHIWDASTKERVGEVLLGHSQPVKSVAWSPDGKAIASGAWGGTLCLWSTPTQAPTKMSLNGHDTAVYSIAWSPDSKTIVTVSTDRTIRLWDVSTGEPIRFGQRWPNSHTHSVYRLTFSRDSQQIVSASADGTLRLWNVKTGALAQRPVSQPSQLSTISFSLDGKYILAEDEEVRTIWGVAGEGDWDDAGPPVGSAEEDPVSILTIDENGWLRDAGGKRMFWIPVVLRPVKHWGRVLMKGNILTMETPTVPIIDISAYVSKDC